MVVPLVGGRYDRGIYLGNFENTSSLEGGWEDFYGCVEELA